MSSQKSCFSCISWLCLLLTLAVASPAPAQQAPGAGYVFPAGGKAGTTVDVRLGGFDWTPDVQFFVHEPGVKLEILGQPGTVLLPEPPFWFGIRSYANDPPLPREVPARFILPSDLQPGPIHWRVANANGGSQCGVFWVSTSNEVTEDEGRRQPQELAMLPVIISGRLGRIEEVDRYRFKADRSGPITCELFARRLGSDFHGVLQVQDDLGRPIIDAVDTQGIDLALTFFAEKGKSYTIALHDLDYRGYRSFTYRLAITPGPRVLAAVPAAGQRGKKGPVEFIGMGVATGKAELESVTREVTFPADPATKSIAYRLETAFGIPTGFSFALSDLPEYAESSNRRLHVPCAVTGTLSSVDARYTFAAKKGDSYEISAQACAANSTLDLALTVRDSTGKEVASNDDAPATMNPKLSVTLPVDGVYEVIVADQSGANPTRTAVYRLMIDRPKSDFHLRMPALANVPIGSVSPIAIQVLRAGGFKEPITLTVTGLPAGVTVPGNLVIPAAANALDITLQCAKDAPATSSLVQITGSAKISDKVVSRTALAPASARASDTDRLPALLVTTTLKPPFKVKPVEADGGRRVHRGATHLAELLVERDPGFTGEITLDMAAVQSRHRQGIRGPVLTVPANTTKIAYPVFLPEWLETMRTSRIALVARAKIPDPRGTPRYVLAGMDGQITMSIEGALLKLAQTGDEYTIQPGQTMVVPLKVARSAKWAGPIEMKLLVPDEIAGLIQADSLVLDPNQETALWKLSTKADKRLLGEWTLTVRATALHNGHPVISEAKIGVEFVNGTRAK